jgi:hypothetical protein
MPTLHPGENATQGERLFRTLLKTDVLTVEDHQVTVHYFELRTQRGTRRFSAEIRLRTDDRIILDDDSLNQLEARTASLVPATLQSRMIAGGANAA